jgi:hypothetical protein
MKLSLIAAATLLLNATAALACAPGVHGSFANRPLNSREYSAVNEVMLHVDVKIPCENWWWNPFGIPDITDRTIAGVYSELVYIGLNTMQQPMFRRREADVIVQETPDHHKFIHPQPEKVGQFTMDYSRGRLITVRDFTLEIIDATPAGVTFTLR